MENRIVDIHSYRFGRSIGIMLLRPLSDNIHDIDFIDHVMVYHPDIVICIGTHPEMDELYKVLSFNYQYNSFFCINNNDTAVIFSRYPVHLKGILYLDTYNTNLYNLTIGPKGDGLNVVYIDSNILHNVSNLSELWFVNSNSTSSFYVDHEFMVARNLDIIEQGDETLMRNTDMKLVYYNFRLKEETL